MADYVYRAELDDSQVLAALKSIDRNVDKLANEGDRNFKRVGNSAKSAGVQIGAISGVVQELTRRFINLAEQAARAFVRMAAGGVELNKELELTRIALTNVLGGNEEAAQAFLEQTRQTARRLRTDYVELAQLAGTILPQANDIQATNKLLEVAVILGKQAGQNATGIRIALQEALAGQFISLQRRLNVPASSIARIKKLGEEMGIVDALVEVLGDRVDELGLSLDSTADTFAATFATLESQGRQIQQIFAAPIFEELNKQGQELLRVLDENSDDIERVAVAFGELAAAAVKFIGTNLVDFIDSLNFEQLEEIADDMQRALAAGELFIDTISSAEFSQNFLDGLQQTVKDLQAILLTLAQISALTEAEIARRKAEAASLQARGKGLKVGPVVIGEADIEARAEGEKAYNDVLLEQLELFEEYQHRLDEINERSEERKKTSEDNTDAALEEAQSYLQLQQRLKELAEAEEAAADAQGKINEKLEEAATEHGRRLIEIALDAERKRIDDAIKAAQKREDIARQNADKIEDIFTKNTQDLTDAARDLSRDEEDIARRAARRRSEVERDSATERVDIEREFRRELERIRDRFNESAEEAERRNDAQAFLEAVRQRDREIREAKRGRDERLEDAATRAVEQRQKLQEQLQFEIEDARIANARKLEDLQIRLERELEQQRLNYQRQLEEQAIAEARSAEQRNREYQRELEDFGRKENQRLQDLRKSLSTEFELIKEAEAAKREVRVLEAQRTVDQVNRILQQLNITSPITAPVGPHARYPGLQGGGRAEAGQPYLVGERGPELFVPDRGGTVVPSPQVVRMPASPAAAAVTNDFSRRMDVGGIHVAEDIFNNPVTLRKMRNLIIGIMAETL